LIKTKNFNPKQNYGESVAVSMRIEPVSSSFQIKVKLISTYPNPFSWMRTTVGDTKKVGLKSY
jgi:hypothetical protein